MAIIRAELPADHFTILRNSVLRDERLTYRARGVLASILSNQSGWRVTVQGLADRGGEGRDAVATAVDELIEAGYIVREHSRGDAGRLAGSNLIVFDTPQTTESLKNRNSENPSFGESVAKKKHVLQKNHAATRAGARETAAGGNDNDAVTDTDLVAAILSDWFGRQGGAAPYRRVVGKWRREVETLIADGAERWVIDAALDQCAERNSGPGLLAHLADDIRRNPEQHRELPLEWEWLRYG